MSIVHLELLLTGSPCQYWSFIHNWQCDPVNSASEYVVDRVNNNQSGAKKCNRLDPVLHRFYPVSSGRDCVIDRVTLSAVGVDVLLTGWPCQQWVVMYYWHGHPVSSGCWCLIDRVTLSAMGVDGILTGSSCQQWGWCLIDHFDSSGCWCLIDRVTLSAVGLVTLSAVGVDVLLTVSPCQQWLLM